MILWVIDILNRAYQMIQIKSKIVSSVFVKRHTPSKAFGYQFFIEITRTWEISSVLECDAWTEITKSFLALDTFLYPYSVFCFSPPHAPSIGHLRASEKVREKAHLHFMYSIDCAVQNIHTINELCCRIISISLSMSCEFDGASNRQFWLKTLYSTPTYTRLKQNEKSMGEKAL